MADGRVAGRTEGRQLGLERGFQKFVEMGRLQGRGIVWANRLGRGSSSSASTGKGLGQGVMGSGSVLGEENGERGGEDGAGGVNGEGNGDGDGVVMELPPLPHKDGGRLAKHITTLYALAETESLSTDNNDEAVSDFDDRLRRAQGRAKVIERMVGEEKRGGDGNGHDPGAGESKAQGGVDI